MNFSTVLSVVASGYRLVKKFPRLKIKVWYARIFCKSGTQEGRIAKIVFTVINPTKIPILIEETSLECSGEMYKPVNTTDGKSTKFPLSIPANRYTDCELYFNTDFSYDTEFKLESKLILNSELMSFTEKVHFTNKRHH